MANTKTEHRALLSALGIEEQHVMVDTLNKIAKRMRSKFKKKHSTNHWDMLRMFHPARFMKLMNAIKGNG